ncbi:MAG: glycosyltransferase family 39 protein [Deltaproteobacteria bacterium]|nr:glycosyltransferase family 39 protein [Deltaproteobacteria bacterium]MDQ3297622.1 glycosyltransferase family 39 protein [Myxococcota bacterium]
MIAPRWIGLVLAVMTMAIVVANQHEVGLARDEIVYMQHGARYADWWLGLAKLEHGASRQHITKSFGGPGATDNNREHPPLMKTLFGLSHRLVHKRLGVDEVTAFRLPSAILHGILVGLVFAMVLALWGTAEATVAALLVMFLPRALFHASLAAFDAPIMTLWFATIYAYWRSLDGRKWPWQVGVVFGLALATKHNALLLPFALGLHYLYVGFRAGGLRGLILHRWRVIVSLALLGPLTLVAVWPWLWFDTYAHLRAWLDFHLTHVHYNFEYLGHNWNAPRFPWHVALVTTLFTVPVVTLAGSLVGAGVWISRRVAAPDRARAPGLLLGLSAAASITPFFLGTTPIFGAEKHWMPALPSLCIAAGVGIVWATRALAERLSRRHATAVLGAFAGVIVLAAAVETVTAQPYALTWYNALAGGPPGGADRGMNRQFWGVAARGALPVLAPHAPATGSAPVYTHDASPAWGFYQKLGLLPRSLPDAGHEAAGIERSRFAIVIHERHFNRHDYLIWKSYGTVQPLYVLRARGVPIVSIYKRRPSR